VHPTNEQAIHTSGSCYTTIAYTIVCTFFGFK
jgi:hypothetical protein